MTDDSYNSYDEPKVCNHYNYKLEGDEWYLREDSFRDKNLITTPGWIVKDMLDLLPDSVWNTETTFLIPCIKSGNFAIEVKNRLFKCQDALKKFPDEFERRKHIDSKQLFCIYWYTEEEFNKNLISGHIWGVNGFLEAIYSPNIKFMCTNDLNFDTFKDKTGKKQEKLLESIKEKFGTVKFDVVIGNPPYNNDLYIDFVQWGHQRANKYSLWITPAKWQAKGGDKNERFRKDIVPHMKDIVYYPETLEVFNISSQGGISYYLMDKEHHNKKELKTVCSIQKIYETKDIETFTFENVLYNNKIQNIIKKLGTYSQLYCEKMPIDKKHNVAITDVYSEKNLSDKQGMSNVTIKPYTQTTVDKKNADTTFIKTFNTEEEASSLISYLETKFIRFMFLMAKSSQHNNSDFSWKFVPDPGSFDTMYEDSPIAGYKPNEQGEYMDSSGNKHCSLYKKYNLTDEEIHIIESVIKERK